MDSQSGATAAPEAANGKPAAKEAKNGAVVASDRALSEEPEDDEWNMPVPPDGGWGWMVVFASFMIHVIADGVMYTFGIFYMDITTNFGSTKAETSWIASIMQGVTFGAGPLVSGLVNRYGCRAVCIAGAFVGGAGFVLTTFAQSVQVMYVTIGLVLGGGLGLIYLPAIVSVTCYFEKKRSFATGIAVCGSGLGTFIFAPLTEHLVTSYGWKNAMLILAAVLCGCSFFGVLFRPLEPVRAPKRQQKATNGVLNKPVLRVAAEDGALSGTAARRPVPRNLTDSDLPDQPSAAAATSIVVTAPGRQEVCRMTSSQPLLARPTPGVQQFGSHDVMHLYQPTGSAASSRRPSQHLEVMRRKDIFYSGSLLNIPQYKSNQDEYEVEVAAPVVDGTARTVVCGCIQCPQDVADTLHDMMGLALLKDPVFLTFAISNFLTSIGFNVPYIYIADKAVQAGLDRDSASFLLSIIGISNTVSRIVLGYISDRPCVNRLWVYNCALTVSGIGTALSAFCTDFPTLALYAAVFGFTIGAYVGLTSVILVDLLGLDKLTNAFGLLLLFQGVATLIGPPIAGALYDATNSYDPGFYVAGTMVAVSGAMLFFIPCVRRCAGNSEVRRQRSGGSRLAEPAA
ncbi:monocarboxylate transporter 3-like isoform X1 [Amphibalanus amphitrite]|uniref:monocarboxylate transporter 3-like isoform X1 n=1 Tax=Amphibalanus amphitrite TaxID=1232801 RepID=UPI001C90D61B|nr:monocarboxylate transporter 3-like isoform X1 [Amphibalanus amphitrite]